MRIIKWTPLALLIALGFSLLLLPNDAPAVAGDSAPASSSTGTESTADPVAPSASDSTGGQAAASAQVPVAEEDRAAVNASWPSSLASTTSLASAVDHPTTRVTLLDTTVVAEGPGVEVAGTTVAIVSAGTYEISGTVADGRIVVDTEDDSSVVLVFNGVVISCSTSSPVYVRNAEKVIITLVDGTENYVADGTAYILEDGGSDGPSAAVFSADDLTINGGGSLTVVANCNHGIQSKDDLRITGGTLTVDAINDGLRGRDSITIRDAEIAIRAGGDGLQSDNEDGAEVGTITVESGSISIIAVLDGMQAATNLAIHGGNISIVAGGGSANSSKTGGGMWSNWNTQMSAADANAISAKGLKAGVSLSITGGTIDIDSADDAVHSNDTLVIRGGTIDVASGDDGIHADTSLAIDGGEITITKSYEGVESADITINDGVIHVVASDDGINAAGGNDGSAMGGRPGQNMFTSSGDQSLTINGGTLLVDAGGDGLDINGPIRMTGGLVVINGPTDNANGALDYSGSFTISGGLLVAAGSAGMAQAPSTSSTQNSAIMTFSSAVAAGTLLHLAGSDGDGVVTFAPTKVFQSVVLSSPDLAIGESYTLYSGGGSTGSYDEGLYSSGAYTPGTEVTSFTVSSTLTTLGSYSGGFSGGGRIRP